MKELAEKDYTALIYESPHRVKKTLSELTKIFGENHPACVARELTKMYETYHRETL